MASVALREAILALQAAVEACDHAAQHLQAVAAQEPPAVDHAVVRYVGLDDADPTPPHGRCCPICSATPGRPCFDAGRFLPEGDYHHGRRNGVPF